MNKFWLLLILPVLLVLWWGIDRRHSGPEIHFTTVEPTRIESTVTTNGKVEPAEWAAARAETAGVVRNILVQRGQTVKAGQILAELDTTAAQSDLAGAEAREEEARAESATVNQGGKAATLADLDDRIKTAQAAVDANQRNYDALQRLAAKQAATRVEVQHASDTLEQAKLLLAQLQDQRRTLITASDKAVARAKLHESQAAVALAQHRVGLGVIRSPIAGTVYQLGNTGSGTATDLKLGAYLQPGELVALIGDLNEVKVTVYVDEPDLGRVALKDPVSITWDARPGHEWWGSVQKLPTQVIALGTRTVGEVTTIVANPNHDLLPGVTVNATIVSKVVPDALSIPKAALHSIRGASGAYKLQGDVIVWTPVKAGISDINNVQIVSGLRPGDRVADRVVEPIDAELKNGMRVRPATE